MFEAFRVCLRDRVPDRSTYLMQNEEQIFGEALGMPAGEARDAFIRNASNGDEGLAERVNGLLRCHNTEPFLLDRPQDMAVLFEDETELAGTEIGNYKLLQQIGEGGMGLVFMAEQFSPVRRKVALKIIRAGMDSKQVLRRFEAERQALAMMDHPNITRVLDAGVSDSSRPYFVMELVRGTSITTYCDEHRIALRERLKLFVDVCHAIHHAHQKGIIHRDLKPSNVMITLHDGVPVAKVIDFGIAKALDRPLTDKTLFTKYTELIGTPEYMSPEQAELSGLDIDIRSDIYSLGVLLYELLTGTTPLDKDQFETAGLLKICETIRNADAETPSEKVTRLSESIDGVAESRQTNPAMLSKFLRGDLDWIILKALSKDRSRRYESAAAFGRDVSRYLEDEPVEAARPSITYKARKFLCKHKMACGFSIAIATILVLSSVVSTLLAINASHSATVAEQRLIELRKQKQKAEVNLKRAEVLEAMAEEVARRKLHDAIFSKSLVRYLAKNVNTLLHTTQTTILAKEGTQEIKAKFQSEDGSQENEILAFSFSIKEFAENGRGNLIKTQEQRIEFLEIILEEQRAEIDTPDMFVAETLEQLGILYNEMGELAKAELAFRECVNIVENLKASSGYHKAVLLKLAENLRDQDKHVQAERCLELAKRGKDDP